MGTYDRKLCWFDMDLSAAPYKTLRYHQKALRKVAFHSSYPLFASCSDDATVHIFHGMVYNDFLQNPLIVPVKVRAVPSSPLDLLENHAHPMIS
eukprot:m.572731 g.572731  ORF g.572731 m.572731 type:complete len:94 (+) comp57868_c0_seq9:2009-2290(+)